MSYTNPRLIVGTPSNQSIYVQQSTPVHPVGTVGVLPDGREYVYVCNRSSAITVGKLCKFTEVDANYDLCTIPTQTTGSTAVGSTILNVTIGSATVAENQFAGEFLSVDTATGVDSLYKIFGNTAVAASTAITLSIEPLRTALTAGTSTVSILNVFSNISVADGTNLATARTQKIAGVTQVAFGAGSTTPQYGWLQKKGLANILQNGTIPVGAALTPSATTAGAVDEAAEVDTAGKYQQIVGYQVALVGASTGYNAAWINV